MKMTPKTLTLTLPLIFSLLIFSLFAPKSYALSQGSELKAGAAVWNLFDDTDRYVMHVAYIHKPLAQFYDLRPTVLLINADQGQHYFAAGIAKDIYRYKDFSIRAAFHAGIVDEAENLGDTVEFYSSIAGLYNVSELLSFEAENGSTFPFPSTPSGMKLGAIARVGQTAASACSIPKNLPDSSKAALKSDVDADLGWSNIASSGMAFLKNTRLNCERS